MVYRRKSTSNESLKFFDTKYKSANTTGHFLPHGIDKNFAVKFLMKSLDPSDVKVIVTFIASSLRTNLTISNRTKITKNSFSST